MPFDDANLEAALDLATQKGAEAAERGQVADYIPALADVDPARFGLVLSGLDGREVARGDVDEPFPIQSMSKVFALVLAMQRIDVGGSVSREMWSRVGREPSGDPFNSLVQLEYERGVPRNPMINAGALVVDDLLLERCDDPRADLCALIGGLVEGEVGVDQEVLRSEGETGYRNRAMANLMRAFGNIHHPIDDVLDTYVAQCSITMTARQAARSMRFLANDGVDPASGRRILSPLLARRVTAIMLTCGTYDAAGEFAYSVGIPCKSGVAGSIMAVVPDELGVCVWSPPLGTSGNSLGGRVALHHLAEELELSIF